MLSTRELTAVVQKEHAIGSRPGQWCNSVEQAASERAIIAR
jgi:hypothetical protein